MQIHDHHVSDEELLLIADGEVSECRNSARAHFETCTDCKTRAAQMETVLIETARATRSRLDADLPSIAGPRAELQSRLAKMSTCNTGFWRRFAVSNTCAAQALCTAAIAIALVLSGVLTFQHFTALGSVRSVLPSDLEVLPNGAFTPGAVRRVSLDQVCSVPHEEVIKAVPPAERERVFAEYGISTTQSGQYEMDYLIAPGLGGDDDIRNLWPEPYKPAKWNAHRKDALEERLHQMVCSRQLDLSVAQQAIATNWIAAYRKYVQISPSNEESDDTSFPLGKAGLKIFAKMIGAYIAPFLFPLRCTSVLPATDPAKLTW